MYSLTTGAPAERAIATTSTVPIAATVAYNFDEGTGTTVTDASGNNWNGAVEGATGDFIDPVVPDRTGADHFVGAAHAATSLRSYLVFPSRPSPR